MQRALIRVNSNKGFLDLACEFLHYRKKSFPFKYLGFPVGANPRLTSTWEPFVNIVSRRLLSWKRKYVFLCGRSILLSSVLNVIPIFYLSFLKMHVKVWKKIMKIQRKFLWEEVKGQPKIVRVKWADVCKSKKLGGLGVLYLQLVNLAFLRKWRWCLLLGASGIW